MSLPEGRTRGSAARSDLVAIAIDEFSRHGYQGTSIDRLARAAGVTKGAIYYHFRDKHELLAATVTDRVEEFERRVQEACTDATPDRALRRIAEVCAEHAQANDHSRFAIKLIVESIDTMDRISEQLRGMMRRFRAFLRNLIIEGVQRGDFSADADAEAAAAGFTSAVLGAEVQYYQDPERFDLSRTLAVYVDHLLADLGAGDRSATATTHNDGEPND